MHEARLRFISPVFRVARFASWIKVAASGARRPANSSPTAASLVFVVKPNPTIRPIGHAAKLIRRRPGLGDRAGEDVAVDYV